MKKTTYLILLFSINFLSSQTKRIKIVSDEGFNPIENVEIYNGEKLIGKSNSDGIVEFDFSKTVSIYIIKDGFKDKYINTAQLESRIILTINKPIELKEVIIRKLKNDEILDSIKNNLIKNKNKYLIPNYFKMSNILKTNNDTLHSINSLFKYEKKNGFGIKENSKILKNFISNFVNNNETLTYRINNKEIEFWEYMTVSYIKLNGQLEFIKVLNNRNKYNYEIYSDSIYHKINFISKNKGNLAFNGYIIVDKIDFGIHEFNLKLSDTKNNKIKLITSKTKIKQSFDILETEYFIKYSKDVKENYNLVYSYLKQQFIQTEGNHLNNKFVKTSEVETSFNYDNIKFQDFDIFNYTIK